jgi:hypothetical protein
MHNVAQKAFLLISFMLVFPTGAIADAVFVPSVAFQYKQLEFDQKYETTTAALLGHKANFKQGLPTVNMQLTTIIDRFYIAFKYEDTMQDVRTEVDETQSAVESAGGFGHYLNTGLGDKTEITRSDISLTLGMKIAQNANMFAGYMKGETELIPESFCEPGCTTIHNLQYEHSLTGNRPYKQKYEEEGFYVGTSYSWPVSDVGTLSLSLAYAVMDGLYEDNYNAIGPGFDFKFEGDSKGTSLGLTWSAPINESTGYFIDLRRQQYDMSADPTKNIASWSTVTVETKETLLGLTAGLQWYF